MVVVTSSLTYDLTFKTILILKKYANLHKKGVILVKMANSCISNFYLERFMMGKRVGKTNVIRSSEILNPICKEF